MLPSPHDQENLVKIYSTFQVVALNEDLDAVVMRREYMSWGDLKLLADVFYQNVSSTHITYQNLYVQILSFTVSVVLVQE